MPKRTKKNHAELLSNRELLLGEGVHTVLWPNERYAMFIQNADGTLGFRITANDGPAGFSLQIDPVNLFRKDMDVFAGMEHIATDGIGGVSIVQYRKDEASQLFRQAYIDNDAQALEEWRRRSGEDS